MAPMLHNRTRNGYVRPVDIPKTLRFSLPEPFGSLVNPSPQGKPGEKAGLDGQWMKVQGDPLPVDVIIRVDRSDDKRFMITGLVIGLHERREITWEALRMIKPATILGYIFSGFDPNDPAKLYEATDPFPMDDNIGDRWRPHARAAAALKLWQASENRPHEDDYQAIKPVTKPRASVATDLAKFAETYLRNLAATPHRATTATAKEMHISRATAIRRIAECRDEGLLPSKASTGE
jgi:hypothetical protein